MGRRVLNSHAYLYSERRRSLSAGLEWVAQARGLERLHSPVEPGCLGIQSSLNPTNAEMSGAMRCKIYELTQDTQAVAPCVFRY